MRSKQPTPSGRRGGGHFDVPQFGLLLGVIVLSGLLVIALALAEGRLSGSAPPSSSSGSLPDKSIGLVNAPVVVIEYADFQCAACRQFVSGALSQLKQDYIETGKARLVFRHLALLGPDSLAAANAAECANAQGQFWEYHDQLFAAPASENSESFNRENLQRFATETALDMAQFNRCLDGGQSEAKVQREMSEAERLGVKQAPTFLVNRQLVNNGSDYSVLQTAIEAALKPATPEFGPGLVGPGLENKE